MSVRVPVILEEDEAARFRSQAMKESKSLSAWLRDAGKKMLETRQQCQPLTDPSALKRFFRRCSEREKGAELLFGIQRKEEEACYLCRGSAGITPCVFAPAADGNP